MERIAHRIGLALLLVSALSVGTVSADVTDMYIGIAPDQTSIYLADGSWDLEDDWDYYINEDGSADAFVSEHWISMDPLALFGYIDTDETDPNIDITKNIDNDSGFTWTGFDISLSWMGGSTVNLITAASGDFPNPVTLDPGCTFGGAADTSPCVVHFTGGAGVPDGGSASFFFSFDILGDFNFTITQTPIPEPTTLCMLTLGGLALIRRR